MHYQLSIVISECLEYSCEQINVKMLFLSFSQKFHALKITGYTVLYLDVTCKLSFVK